MYNIYYAFNHAFEIFVQDKENRPNEKAATPFVHRRVACVSRIFNTRHRRGTKLTTSRWE